MFYLCQFINHKVKTNPQLHFILTQLYLMSHFTPAVRNYACCKSLVLFSVFLLFTCQILLSPLTCLLTQACGLKKVSLEASQMLWLLFKEPQQRDEGVSLPQLDTDVYSSFNEIQHHHLSDCSLSGRSDWTFSLGMKEMGRLRRERFFSSWLSYIYWWRWCSDNGVAQSGG